MKFTDTETYIQVADYDLGITARYSGGAYIEIGHVDWDDDGRWVAEDVINVYNYAMGRPEIEPSIPAVIGAIAEWAAANTEADAETA